jgi:hypothetical protein
MATMKYIRSIRESSVFPILNVNLGGMKKKSQINALNRAAKSTGRISKNMAIRETVTSKMKATTLYPMNEENKKQAEDTAQTNSILSRYCFAFVSVLKIVCFIFQSKSRLIYIKML